MRIMFLSDIHGDAEALQRAVELFDQEGAHYIALLGDALYHGPRNRVPDGYNPTATAELLNSLSEKIIAVRGNCDSEVDQMLIHYPMMGDYTIVFEGGRRFFLTHGHLFNPGNLPPLAKGDVFASGHTHIPVAEKNGDGIVLFNPGSISLPKQNFPQSYGLYDDGVLSVKDFSGNSIQHITL